MIFETPMLPPSKCEKVSPLDMNLYPMILTPPTDDNSSPYLETLQVMHTSPNQTFPTQYTMDVNTGQLVQIHSPMVIDDISSDGCSTVPGASLKIIEHPVDKFRFRYKSEMTGTHGSLNGMNNDKSRKVTYPTVELAGVTTSAIIRCSIYQINAIGRNNMPHAHRLVRKLGSKDEVDDPHDIEVGPENNFQAVFKNMGIIHTAKKNIVGELVKKKTKLKLEEVARTEGRRRELNTKEEVEIKRLAESESKSINLNVVCLRFDAFFNKNGILYQICDPVFTHGINNLKSALTGELKIVRMDHCTSPAKGGLEIFILVERVTKKNIKIRFFEVDDNDVEVWEDFGKFSDLDVHHQYAIVFKTPPYKDKTITSSVKVFIELLRPTDNSKSEPKEFTYVPCSKDYRSGSKRPRYNDSFSSSSLSSSEIPQTIEDVNINSIMNNLLSSDELQRAAQNINSDEFKMLCKSQVFADYIRCESGDGVPLFNNSLTVLDGTKQEIGNSSSDKEMAQRVFSEILELLKTKPSRDDIFNTLKYHLNTDNKNNALHVFIKENNFQNVQLLLYLINRVSPSLLNVKNSNGKTPLWLAVSAGNVHIVKALLQAGASILTSNAEGNTVLHKSISMFIIEVFESLMSSTEINKCIDSENNDGDTPLKLAIDNKNIAAVKLLCKYGVDVNRIHKKSGFTPLRMAVEAQELEMVRLLLMQQTLDASIVDFNGIAPLQAAVENKAIYKLILDHLEKTGVVDIKSEVTSTYSDEDMDCIKTEEETPDDIESLYENVTRFTENCLDAVSSILDRSGNYKNLADLLELDHLLQLDLIDSQSPSKVLLSHAETSETIYNIRNFLENLDEVEAVQAIDEMVKSLNLHS